MTGRIRPALIASARVLHAAACLAAIAAVAALGAFMVIP